MDEEPDTLYRFPEKTAEALQGLIRLVALSNAGGVVATISVINANADIDGISRVFAFPLGFFVGGIILTILYALSYTLRVFDSDDWHKGPEFLMSLNFMNGTGYGAIAFFVFGCVSGILIVGCV